MKNARRTRAFDHSHEEKSMSATPIGALPTDTDSQETREWLDALEAVIEQEGPERAHFLVERLIDLARQAGVNLPYSATTE